jgi:1,4-alpha-glucan branching enzyme
MQVDREVAMAAALLLRKATHFVLWRPRQTEPPPRLIIGKLQSGNPPTFIDVRRFDLQPSTQGSDLWEIPLASCFLTDGEVYHYWFEVTDSNPYKNSHPRLWCTDPTAWTVDWRLLAPPPDDVSFGENDRDPAGVVKVQGGQLVPCDPVGETIDWTGDPPLHTLPANHRLVMYELPTTWSRLESFEAPVQLSVGTFRDVQALVDNGAGAYLRQLGINALELLPPADSFVDREWGYATSNYFAADHDLGFPRGHASPTASTDLAQLIRACHRCGIRFVTDTVMAFATQYAYQNVNYLDFHVHVNAGDPEELNQGQRRDAFGGDLFKYNFWVTGDDPLSGGMRTFVPARQLMLTYLVRWMQDFRIDGLRLDSIVNIANWDFVQEFKDLARHLWQLRGQGQNLPTVDADARFLVVGEELAVPLALFRQGRLDGLWNEHFKHLVRAAILGQTASAQPNFAATVRALIDCRELGFEDLSQAINYVTSHDVEGFRNERLFNFLPNNGVVDTERRIKLAFVCLLTAVGVPMIFAGEEFADEHDLPLRHPEKQVDPVNFDRAKEPWRQRVLGYVSRLVKFRTTSDALSVNDTDFLHTDLHEGKRVVVWRRGRASSDALVVVVANFSDYGMPEPLSPHAKYVVPHWPATPPGKAWREITQDRFVPPEWVGREPIFPWEAKVYALS